MHAAVDAGVNYFDLFVGTPTTREYYGKALKGIRNKIYLAGHLGCADKDGQYVKTRDESLCRDFLQQFYEKLDTDYIDVLFLHNCLPGFFQVFMEDLALLKIRASFIDRDIIITS